MRKRAPESKKLPKIVKGMKVECLTDIVNGKIPEWHVGRIVRVGKLGFELFLPRTGNRLYRCRSADFEKTWRLPRRRSRPAAVKAAPKIPKVVPDMAIEVRAHDRWHRAVIREVFPRGRFRFGGGEIIGTRRRADFGTTWRLPQKAVGPATAPKLGDVVEFRGKAFPWRPFEVTRAPDARGFFEAKDQQTGKREWRSVRTVGRAGAGRRRLPGSRSQSGRRSSATPCLRACPWAR